MAVFIGSGLAVSPDTPLNHARIGYQSIITNAGLSGTPGRSGYPLSNIIVDQTFEKYKPASTPVTIDIDAGQAEECDYLGIVANGQGTVTLSYKIDAVNYEAAIEFTPASNSISLALFAPVVARYWRITFTAVESITNIKLGKVLEMQRGIYGGHSPLPLSAKTVRKGNISETGQWLGRTVQRRGFATSYAWQNLSAPWYRQYFQPFVEHSETGTFYISWHPEKHADEVGFCWCQNDIQPSNQGVINFMSVSMQVEGYDVNSV